MKKLFLFSLAIFVSSCGVTTKQLRVSTPGHTSTTDIYSSADLKKQNNKLAFIALHPKGGKGRLHPGVESIGNMLSAGGYTVYAPDMPWSPYTATLNNAFEHIDKLVVEASKEGAKVFVMGHSIGAAVAYLYCSAYKPPPAVAGVILMGPGHMLQVSNYIQEATALDVQRARKLVKKGAGDENASFTDYNQGAKPGITTTPRIFLSYFDPREFPNPATNLDTLKVPILWIDGEYDKAAARQGFENLFNRLNKYTKYPQNKYIEVPTGHFDVPEASSEAILKWVKQFE